MNATIKTIAMAPTSNIPNDFHFCALMVRRHNCDTTSTKCPTRKSRTLSCDVSSPHYRAASISFSHEIHSFQSSLIVVSALARARG